MDKHLHTINVYNQHVREYVNKFMTLDLYKDSFDRLMKYLPVNAKVLELGCGPGNVVKYLKTNRPDLDILGIDLAPEMIKEAERQNPSSGFKIMNIRDIGQLKQQPFNAIIAAFCLPYISYNENDDLFRNIHDLLAANGIFYLSCMEGPAEHSGFEKTSFTGNAEIFINYYLRSEIESKLKEQYFSTMEFYTKDYREMDGSTTTDIIYIAEKKI